MLLPSVPSPQLDGAVLTEHQSPKVPPGWHTAFQVCVDGVVVAPVVPALLPWGRGRQRGWRRGGRAGTRDSLVNPQSAWGGLWTLGAKVGPERNFLPCHPGGEGFCSQAGL